MAYRINIGDRIPKFSAKDQEGGIVTDEDLLGAPCVLYFYPKDGTSVCTKEACDFRDHIETLDDIDAVVIGISPDSPSSHQNFIEKHQLNFTLLCDEERELCKLFDVLHEKNIAGKTPNGVERTTFVIDSEGVIRWLERPVNVEGHTKRVIAAIQEHCANI